VCRRESRSGDEIAIDRTGPGAAVQLAGQMKRQCIFNRTRLDMAVIGRRRLPPQPPLLLLQLLHVIQSIPTPHVSVCVCVCVCWRCTVWCGVTDARARAPRRIAPHRAAPRRAPSISSRRTSSRRTRHANNSRLGLGVQMDGANLEEHAGAYSPPQSAAACYRPFEEKVMFSKLTHSTHTHTHTQTYLFLQLQLWPE